MNAPACQVIFTFEDKESNKGTITFYCSFSLSGSALLALLNTLANLLQPLSNAALTNVKVTYKMVLVPYSPTLPEGDLTSRALLIYREGDTYEAIAIPDPQEALFEEEGEYRTIRININSDAMATWMASWSDTSGRIRTKEGGTFPPTWEVGGRAL